MKKVNFETFIDQRNPLSHLLFGLITLVMVTWVSLKNPSRISFSGLIAYYILGLVQLEVFIYFARLIFKKFETNTPGREFTKMILTRFFFFLGLCFIAAFTIIILFELITGSIRGAESHSVIKEFFDKGFDGWLKSTLGGLTFGAIVFIVIQWQDALKREQKLREENLIFQNETLKSQINPHFLFNSLNTVSSLIASDPDKAEVFILNLSSVYRYFLENGQKDTVVVQDELELVNRYFDLHRVRDEDKISLSIDYSNGGGYRILPVSLQILIENAIKHNIATRENPLMISIYFEDQYIVVRNNLRRKASQMPSTGLGLRNLAERVRLTTGKVLIIEENDKYFIAKVPLVK